MNNILCDNTVFRFRFTTSKSSVNSRLHYTVYAYTRHDMDLFLKQHGFDVNNSHIDCIPMTEFDGNSDLILSSHKFKSNSSDEIYNIMTTPMFVTDAINLVCSDLSESLIFGEPIMHAKIEFIKLINDLIYELPYVFILDHSVVDEDTGELISPFWDSYVKMYGYDEAKYCTEVYFDDSYIYDSIHNASIPDKVQPITVEAYVTNFTQILMDVFE